MYQEETNTSWTHAHAGTDWFQQQWIIRNCNCHVSWAETRMPAVQSNKNERTPQEILRHAATFTFSIKGMCQEEIQVCPQGKAVVQVYCSCRLPDSGWYRVHTVTSGTIYSAGCIKVPKQKIKDINQAWYCKCCSKLCTCCSCSISLAFTVLQMPTILMFTTIV